MNLHGRSVVPYLLLLPAFLFFVPFVLLPYLHTLGLSLYEWDGLAPARYVGLMNYREAFASPLVRSAFVHAILLVGFFAVLPILLALPLAAASARAPGGIALRTLIFMPQVISTVVIGVSWSWILALDGPINAALRGLGLSHSIDWLGSYTWALPSIGMIGSWMLIGLCLALFHAGLQRIPESLYDAAIVDGANVRRRFFAVTLPGLSNPIAVALTLTVVAALRVFDLVFVTTRGGPGTETMVPGLMIYRRAFDDGQLGSAAAIAAVLSLVVFGFTLLINQVAERQRR
jgi:ABC-type sugar transport system permease subunit